MKYRNGTNLVFVDFFCHKLRFRVGVGRGGRGETSIRGLREKKSTKTGLVASSGRGPLYNLLIIDYSLLPSSLVTRDKRTNAYILLQSHD